MKEVSLRVFRGLSAVAGEILGSLSFCFVFFYWKHVSHDEYLTVIQDYSISLPLKSQVNKWKVFAFVSRQASPASAGRAADLETMCCGLLFPSLPTGSPSLHSVCVSVCVCVFLMGGFDIAIQQSCFSPQPGDISGVWLM